MLTKYGAEKIDKTTMTVDHKHSDRCSATSNKGVEFQHGHEPEGVRLYQNALYERCSLEVENEPSNQGRWKVTSTTKDANEQTLSQDYDLKIKKEITKAPISPTSSVTVQSGNYITVFIPNLKTVQSCTLLDQVLHF